MSRITNKPLQQNSVMQVHLTWPLYMIPRDDYLAGFLYVFFGLWQVHPPAAERISI